MVYYKGFLTVQYSYSNRIEMIRDFQDDCRFYSKFFTNEAKKHRERVKNGYFLNTIDIKYYLKDFYRAENLKFLINKLLYNEYKIKTLPHDNDGIIFTKNLYPYVPGKTKGILKWKPVEMNTIDFFITVNEDLEEVLGQYVSDDDFYIFELYTIYQQKIYLFDYMFVFDQDKKMEIFSKFKTFKFKNAEEVDGVIAECKYDKEECGGFKLQ